eukprot:Nk52_evm23s233 gene=Nk52_evmTU23s233
MGTLGEGWGEEKGEGSSGKRQGGILKGVQWTAYGGLGRSDMKEEEEEERGSCSARVVLTVEERGGGGGVQKKSETGTRKMCLDMGMEDLLLLYDALEKVQGDLDEKTRG